jgi:hypothetical protein
LASEAAVIARIRAIVERRDVYCRIGKALCGIGRCAGALEWAHLGDHRRFKTRGLPPEERHTTRGTLMLCSQHHHDYDQHRLEIEALTEREADGPLAFVGFGKRFEEAA